MDFDLLVDELKSLNSQIGSYSFYIFGLKYAQELNDVNISQLIKSAGLTESMSKEIGKAKRVAEYIKTGKYGLALNIACREKREYTKEELAKILAGFFLDSEINATVAGGIFTYCYGIYAVDKYTPTELMEAAHEIDGRVKTRYAAELNGAFLMYRYFKKHPELACCIGTNNVMQNIDSPSFVKKSSLPHVTFDASNAVYPFIAAIRTKPFILLAGISGTGKSRIVRKLAQATDDIDNFANDEERFSCHTPSNFCLIQVKPNWHNSMDVVGFKSNIGGEHYEYTPFVEFIAKAWQHQDTPFFLCLDEMNLAPVEEYFAEFLSAIESRSVGSNGEYETDPVIKPFDGFGEKVRKDMLDHLIGTVNASDIDANSEKGKMVKRFREKGLTLPKNLIVMGTVNMDETTFSFSRKVLDRAMSIEMNEVNYDEFLNGTTDNDIPVLVDRNHDLVERFVKAQQVKDFIDAEEVKNFLVSVNALLEGTPFKLGYRAANEAMLYVAAAKTFGNDNLASALDDFTMMKILSRIEGDESKLRTKDGDELLDKLYELFEKRFSGLGKSKTLTKLEQMQHDLKRDHFVSFWG